MRITTNNQPRDLISFRSLTPKEREYFDYIEEEDYHTERFFRYRGDVYDAYEFVRIAPRYRAVGFEYAAEEGSPLLDWHGIHTDTYFSALVVKLYEDSVVVGRVYS